MTLDEIVAIYESKKTTTPSNQKKIETTDITQDVITQIESLNARQLEILIYFNQAILNFFTKHEGIRNAVIAAM